MSQTVSYFGYGSLVNRRTRPTEEVWEATSVAGWQRSWSHRVVRPEAAAVAQDPAVGGFSVLTVQPASKVCIDGVQVSMASEELPQLDAREGGYNRHSVITAASSDLVAMYVSRTEHVAAASKDYPLLQSYVDCVMAGFLAVFGWDGVDRFINSTAGWQAPMLLDRAEPLYPRAVTIATEIQAEFDARIALKR